MFYYLFQTGPLRINIRQSQQKSTGLSWPKPGIFNDSIQFRWSVTMPMHRDYSNCLVWPNCDNYFIKVTLNIVLFQDNYNLQPSLTSVTFLWIDHICAALMKRGFNWLKIQDHNLWPMHMAWIFRYLIPSISHIIPALTGWV